MKRRSYFFPEDVPVSSRRAVIEEEGKRRESSSTTHSPTIYLCGRFDYVPFYRLVQSCADPQFDGRFPVQGRRHTCVCRVVELQNDSEELCLAEGGYNGVSLYRKTFDGTFHLQQVRSPSQDDRNASVSDVLSLSYCDGLTSLVCAADEYASLEVFNVRTGKAHVPNFQPLERGDRAPPCASKLLHVREWDSSVVYISGTQSIGECDLRQETQTTSLAWLYSCDMSALPSRSLVATLSYNETFRIYDRRLGFQSFVAGGSVDVKPSCVCFSDDLQLLFIGCGSFITVFDVRDFASPLRCFYTGSGNHRIAQIDSNRLVSLGRTSPTIFKPSGKIVSSSIRESGSVLGCCVIAKEVFESRQCLDERIQFLNAFLSEDYTVSVVLQTGVLKVVVALLHEFSGFIA